MIRLLVSAILLFSAAPAAGEEPRLDDFVFMEGRWLGEIDGLAFEEIWSPPAAGMMAGMARGWRGESVSVLEYILVVEEENGVFMRFKHFNLDYSTWETDGPIVLRFIEAGDGDALFRNDDPQAEVQTIHYRLIGDGALQADIGLVRNGAPGGFSLTFRKLD